MFSAEDLAVIIQEIREPTDVEEVFPFLQQVIKWERKQYNSNGGTLENVIRFVGLNTQNEYFTNVR